MKIMRRAALWAILGVPCCLAATPASFACSTPPTLTITYSWAPNASVSVIPNNVPSGPVSTAFSNWNVGMYNLCYPPVFHLGTSGSISPLINMTYGSIPPPSNCPNCVTRGQTHLDTAGISFGRISSVNITINSVVTDAIAITEVVAHEFGHTLGLADCNYAGCPKFSSVMEAGAPVTSVNSLIGQPGPTSCDIIAVTLVATDYKCPPPPPPSRCSPILTCTEGYVWDNSVCDCVPGGSPIIIDISGKGFDLTSAADGVRFDISGTGTAVQMAWTAAEADNAFLALPGTDGLVHNGKQLFGNFTPQPQSATPNGFAALAVYDDPKSGGNGDGTIDGRDAIFSSLRLWIDENHDGISHPEELHTLPSLGVNSISLDYHESRRKDKYGNLFRYKSKVNPDDPDASRAGRIAYDVFFIRFDLAAKHDGANLILTAAQKKCPIIPPRTGALPTGKF